MPDLPARLSVETSHSRQVVRAVQAQERTELAVFEHHLQARYLAEIERIEPDRV